MLLLTSFISSTYSFLPLTDVRNNKILVVLVNKIKATIDVDQGKLSLANTIKATVIADKGKLVCHQTYK